MGNQLGRLVLLIGIAIFAAGCSPNSDGLKRVMNLDKANLTWRGDYDNKTPANGPVSDGSMAMATVDRQPILANMTRLWLLSTAYRQTPQLYF